MITLSPADASILTRVIQYRRIPLDERLKLLETASPDAQAVGRVILQRDQPTSEEVRVAADAFLKWLQGNRRVGKLRPMRRQLARVT